MRMRPIPFRERVAKHQAENPAGCWLWEGSCGNGGRYGWTSVMLNGKRQTKWTHRFAYELVVGPIPKGLTLDHLCQNTKCMNPKHLEPCTRAENARRMQERNWSPTCKRGHPLVEGNLYKNPKARDCATCRRDGKRALYARHKAAGRNPKHPRRAA